MEIEKMINMIHNNSSDPVLIKKISLKIWSLRDEVEARIQEQIEQGADPEKINLRALKHEYTGKAKQHNNVIAINTGAPVEAPVGENASGEEAPSENATSQEAQNQEAQAQQDPNLIAIRVDAPNIPEDKIYAGKTVLAEIGMEKMFFFTNKAFTEGTSIVVQFCIPKTFVMTAEVIYCRPYSLKSKIISQNNYTHRALIKFHFLREGERALMRQFLQSIEPDLSKYPRKSEKAAKDKSSGGASGGIEDLGL